MDWLGGPKTWIALATLIYVQKICLETICLSLSCNAGSKY